MPIPNQDAVKSVLDTVRDQILGAVRGAWEDWQGSEQSVTWRVKRSRANFVWEQIIDRAHRAFAEMRHVVIIDGGESFKFLVQDEVLFRFKKADETGRTSNVSTQLALAFHDHEQGLFGLPEVQRVEVVYKLNRLETSVSDICVVARDGDKVVWEYSLLDAAEVIVPLPFPAPGIEPEKPAVRLVKARETPSPERKQQD